MGMLELLFQRTFGVELSLWGRKVPWNFRSLELSLPGTLVQVQLAVPRLSVEPVVPALNVIVRPDGWLVGQPGTGWPQPAHDPRLLDVCRQVGDNCWRRPAARRRATGTQAGYVPQASTEEPSDICNVLLWCLPVADLTRFKSWGTWRAIFFHCCSAYALLKRSPLLYPFILVILVSSAFFRPTFELLAVISNVQGAKVPGSECSRERKFQGAKVPWNFSFLGAKVPVNESSREQKFYPSVLR